MKHTDRNKPPITSPPIFDELPAELRPLKQWVLWRYVWKATNACRMVDGIHHWQPEPGITATHHPNECKAVRGELPGVWAKIPMRPDGTPASSTNPEDWSTFDTVTLAYNQREKYFSGIGFVFTRESGYVGIDLDGCIEWVEVDGVLCPVFGNLIKRTLAKIPETYIEYSPSRTGAHFIVKANPKQAIKYQTEDGDIEIYAEGRYFTMTGDVIDSAPVADATEAVDEIVAIILGERNQASPQPAEATPIANVPMAYLSIEERLEMALHHAANSEQIKKLFDGDISDYKTAENEGRSEADMALCRYLAFYAEGNPTICHRAVT
jgi:putative DNA primase/helicase